MALVFWVKFELSYENCFPDANRIFKVLEVERRDGGLHKTDWIRPGITKQLKENFPEIEAAAYIAHEQLPFTFEDGEGIMLDYARVLSDFFKIFQYEYVKGSQEAFEHSEKSGALSGNLVALSDKYIFVTDYRMGLFCYDADGNFLDTIIGGAYSKEKSALTPANSDSNASHMMFYVHSDNLSGYLGGVSVAGDYCLFLTREGEVNMISFYHIPTKTKSADTDKDRTNLNFYNLSSVNLPLKRPFPGGISVFLNQETYLVE